MYQFITNERVWWIVPGILVLASVHLMYNWIFSDVELESRVEQVTSLIHISPVAMMADSILGHQLDQLAPVRMEIDVMVEEDILYIKHTHMPNHYIHKAVEFGEVKLFYVPTNQQYADIFTKNLAKLKFKIGRKALHLIKHS